MVRSYTCLPERIGANSVTLTSGALMVMLFLARGAGLPIREASGMIRETATAELLPVPAAKASRRAGWRG